MLFKHRESFLDLIGKPALDSINLNIRYYEFSDFLGESRVKFVWLKKS